MMLPTPRVLIFLALGLIPLILVGFWPGLASAIAFYDLMVILLMLVDCLLAKNRQGYRFSRHLPCAFILGQPNQVSLHLENRGSCPLNFWLRDDFPLSCDTDFKDQKLYLPPFQSKQISYRVTPTQRGSHEFGDIHFRLIGPLGLSFYQGKQESRSKINAYPGLQDIKRWRSRFSYLSMNGTHLMPRSTGEGREFEKLREYLPDDSFRDVDWRATARKQKPITRVYETERSQSIYLCLDAGRMMATRLGDTRLKATRAVLTKFDYALQAALILANLAIQQDDRVGMAVFSSGLSSFLPAKKGKAQLSLCLKRLNEIKPTSTFVDYKEFFRQFLLKRQRRSLLVIFTDFMDRENCRGLLEAIRIVRNRHLLLIVTVQDREVAALQEKYPTDISDLYCILAATEVLNERKILLQYLQQEGVKVLEARPDDLASATVKRYLEIKRRGAL